MTWPQYFDGLAWENKLAVKYGVNSIPATYLLDGQGTIILKTAVNAKTPRGKGARNSEMARERQA